MKTNQGDESISLAEEKINLEIEAGMKKKDVIGSCPFAGVKEGSLVCPVKGPHCKDNDINLSQCAQYAILTERLIMKMKHQIRAVCASCRRVEIDDHWLKREELTISGFGHIPMDIWEKISDSLPLVFCPDCQPKFTEEQNKK